MLRSHRTSFVILRIMPTHKNSRMPDLLRAYRTWFIAFFQIGLVCFSLFLSWLLRFDFSLPYRPILFKALPILVAIRVAVLAYFGLLRGWWKYAGVRDGLDILKAVGMGSVLFWTALLVSGGITGFPRTVFALEALLTACLLVGVRFLSRAVAESVQENLSPCKRVLLIGAGSAADIILREVRRPGSGYFPVGCLDDNRSKLGIRISDVPVIGTVDQLPELVVSEGVEEVLIAVPSATGQEMRRFVEICNKTKVKFRTVPALKDIIAGHVAVNQLRDVSLEDLLGREPVQIDLEKVRRNISGRNVMVTGAAGSIGSELCRQILEYQPARLICLDQSESGLFFLRLELMQRPTVTESVFCVADVTDGVSLRRRLAECKPEMIFHAAAYKHVPMMEFNVQEAVKNNVLGLLGLLQVADEEGCKNFILVSSDKAVNPTNIMGATKRICELILSSRPPNGMRCVSVRFGNVLGSSGSVVPILKQQLQDQQPLTITHPEIKRFFMTTQEAVALVLEAFTIGDHGDILVLEMGEPVKIVDLARTLIRLSGKSENDVEIRFTGLREGEKLKEELFYEYEEIFPTTCEKIKRTKAALRPWPDLCLHLDELRASLSVDGANPVRSKVSEIVPEYVYPSDDSSDSEAPLGPGKHFRAVAGDD